MMNGFGRKSCTGFWGLCVGLVLAVCFVLAGSAGAQEDSIKLFSNLTKQRATAEFSDLKGNAIVFEKDNRETPGYTAKTIE
jgi:hypothetical protein